MASSQPYDVCILHLADARFYPLFQRQAFALRDAGFRIALVSWEGSPGEGQPDWPGIDVIPITLPAASFSGKRFFLSYLVCLTRLLLRTKARLYQAVDPITLPSARVAARWHGTRYNYYSLEYFQGTDQLVGRPLTRWVWYHMERFGLRAARNTGVVCRSTAERLAQRFHIGTPHVVRNVPPAKDYAGLPAASRLRAELALPDDCRLAVFKGDIAESRGLEPFVRAQLKTDRVHLALIGDGPFREELASGAAELGLTDRVHFVGRVPPSDFPALLAGADLGHVIHENVGTNLPLTLPSKVFDYMHAGLPMISGNQGEMAELVRVNDIGWVTNPDSQESVDHAVQEFAKMPPEALAEMGRRARTAAQQYCWEIERVAYVAYVKEALGSGDGRTGGPVG